MKGSSEYRSRTDLFVGFGGVALLLALIGLYSMTSFNVAQRSREIAIRVALGGSRGSIVRLVVQPLSAISAVAVAIGLTLSAALATALSSLLYAVTPIDPIVSAATSAAFMVLVLAVGGWAAHRTTSIQPLDVLKTD